MTADQIAIETPPARMTTGELMAALRASYGPEGDITRRRRGDAGEPEILVEEVAAPGSTRRCDLLRIGLWPSRGHRIIVHELKVSRADWQKELADPAKAEAWWPYCHEFWIVAPDGVVDVNEVPEGWGLMVPPANRRHKKFRVKKPAARKEPKLTPTLVAEITRRVDNHRLGQIADLNRQRDELIDKARQEWQRQREQVALSPDVQRRLALLEQLEKALGARLDRWGRNSLTDGTLETVTPEELATALREYTKDHAELQRRQEAVTRFTETLRKTALGTLENLQRATGPTPIRANREW